MLLSEEQADKQTNTGKNITSLAEVIKVIVSIFLCAMRLT